MNFQKKYFYTFRDINNIVYTIEIWQDTVTVLTPLEIRGDAVPFTIQYPAIKNKFEPVRGSGCEMNLLSETDRQFFGLYTGKMQEYQIRCYRGGLMYWCGYLDSELYRENFSELTNYSVNFTGTDGFALLERMNYLDAFGLQFGGIKSQWEMITYILGKLCLPYNHIFVGISTTSNDFTIGATETIFHKTHTFQANWYNEDGEAETCRKVLEEILKPYGAYIVQDGGNIYITDINTLAKSNNQPFLKFNASTYAYVSTDTINLSLGDISTIKMAKNSSSFDIVNGINKQVIKFSPYPSAIFDNDLSSDFSGEGTTTKYGTTQTGYNQTEYANSKSWIKSGNGRFIKNTVINNGNTDYYLAITPYAGEGQHINAANLSFSTKLNLPYLISSDKYKLKISMSTFLEMASNAGAASLPCDTVSIYRLHARIWNANTTLYNNEIESSFVVSFYPKSTKQDGSWGFAEAVTNNTNPVYYAMDFVDYVGLNSDNNLTAYNYMENKWNTFKYQSTYYTTASGSDGVIVKDYDVIESLVMYNRDASPLTMQIYGFVAYGVQGNIIASNIFKELRIKDIKFTLVDLKGNEVSTSDIEYVSYLDANLKNEGAKIDLILGTSITQNPVEKAGLLGNVDYSFIFPMNKYFYLTSWNREGATDIIEKLLARSIQSNYQLPTQQLSCTINMIPSILGCLSYNNFLPSKTLMVTSCNHDLEEATSEIVLQEINSDNLTII